MVIYRVLVLDENEGIYVRDFKSGRVRAVIGKTYMLTQDEELWEKELPLKIEQFLQSNSLVEKYVRIKETDAKTTTTSSSSLQTTKRDKSKVVTYHVSQNEAVQVYDYKMKSSRIFFGPELIMLAPDEHFTFINLSGSIRVSLFLLAFLSLFSVYKKALNYKKYFFYSFIVLIFCLVLRRFI
jgi:major vault protein